MAAKVHRKAVPNLGGSSHQSLLGSGTLLSPAKRDLTARKRRGKEALGVNRREKVRLC